MYTVYCIVCSKDKYNVYYVYPTHVVRCVYSTKRTALRDQFLNFSDTFKFTSRRCLLRGGDGFNQNDTHDANDACNDF